MSYAIECKYLSVALETFYHHSLILQKMKEDNISSQLGDYDMPFCEQQYTNGSCYISLFKFKLFDQFIPPPPQTASNFRHLLTYGTIGRVTAVFQRCACFLAFKFSTRKTAIKFQKCFCVTLFQEFVTDYHLE